MKAPIASMDSKRAELKELFNSSDDFQAVDHLFQETKCELIYIDSLVKRQYLDQYILPELAGAGFPIEHLKKAFQGEDRTDRSSEQLADLLLEGKALFLFQEEIISLDAADLPKRAPEESALETSIRGPKDGFVEDLNTNISLVRRRLSSPALSVEKRTVGKRSRTNIAILYLKDVLDQRILEELHERLDRIDIDVLASSHELESLIEDHPYSIFPTLDYTGRPDYIVESLNQGRFALMVDGSPTASIAPVNLLLQVKSPEDMNINYFFVSLERLLRMLAVMISAFLPGVWVAFSAYNIEQIPYPLVATISTSRFGLPLSAPLEMFIVLFLFEFFNEAGIRLPRAIGQTVSVLGGLIVGDAAIRAGLTSPTMLVVGAITYISSFTVVNQSLKSGLTTLRFIVLLMSTLFGVLGILLSYILTVLYLASKSSFGSLYLGSVAPISGTEALKSFLRLPIQFYRTRTKSTSPHDRTREGGNGR